jgi:hypothetical protein
LKAVARKIAYADRWRPTSHRVNIPVVLPIEQGIYGASVSKSSSVKGKTIENADAIKEVCSLAVVRVMLGESDGVRRAISDSYEQGASDKNLGVGSIASQSMVDVDGVDRWIRWTEVDSDRRDCTRIGP